MNTVAFHLIPLRCSRIVSSLTDSSLMSHLTDETADLILRISTFSIQFTQLAKMITHGRQAERFGEPVPVPYHCLSNEAPEFPALAIQQSQPDQHPRQRRERANSVVVLRLGRFLSCASHRIERPLIVFAGTVNGAHDCLIALDQQRGIHASLEIERAGSIVA